MSAQKPGVTTRSNREAIDERGDAYFELLGERFDAIQAIADRCDQAGIIVSDLTLMDGLTSGKLTLNVDDLAALLGIPDHRQDDGKETT